MNWRAVLAIVQKDMVEAVKNRYLLIGLLLPIGLSLLLGLFLPGTGGDLTLKVAVYDPAGSRLVAGLRQQMQVRVLEAASEAELLDIVEKDAVGGLAVPAGFDREVAEERQPELKVYLNRRRGGGAVLAFQRLLEGQVWALVGQGPPARIVSVDVATPAGTDFDIDRYLLVMMVVIVLAMTGAFSVPYLLVEEKERHTLQALLVSPAGPAEVTVGKAIVGMVYGLLMTGVLLVLNRGWEGDWWMTLLLVFAGALLSVAVGLLLGGFLHTTMQVNTWSTVLLLILLVPSWVVILDLPTPLQVVIQLIPTHYLVHALELSLAGGATLALVGLDLAVVLGSAVLLLALVAWRLRRAES